MVAYRTSFLGQVKERAGGALQERLRRSWLARDLSGRPAPEAEALSLSLPDHAVPAWLLRPPSGGRAPGVVLVPGALRSGQAFASFGEVVHAHEIAALGVAALYFDPAGRGASTGFEDFGGPVQQAELAAAIARLMDDPGIDPGCVGVVSISLGISTAAGALAGPARGLPVAFLLDWEGPSDRRNVTRDGLCPWLAGYRSLDDEGFWAAREPVRLLPGVGAGYHRYQGARDHAQGAHRGHALALLGAARWGEAAWTRLNADPPGKDYGGLDPEAIRWAPSGRIGANRGLLATIARACRQPAPPWRGW